MTVEKESSFVAEEFWTPQRKAGSASGQLNEQVFKPTLASVSPLEVRLQMSTSQGHYEGNAKQHLHTVPTHKHWPPSSSFLHIYPYPSFSNNSIPEQRKNYIQMIGSHHIHCYSFSCPMVWLLVLSLSELCSHSRPPVLSFATHNIFQKLIFS